jgi:hypothetical protein
MIIYYQRPQSYEDWQADRQKAMDARSDLQKFNDLRYQQLNQSDEFYFGLPGRIIERQDAAEANRPIGDRGERLSAILGFQVDVGLMFVGGTVGKIARSTWQFFRNV